MDKRHTFFTFSEGLNGALLMACFFPLHFICAGNSKLYLAVPTNSPTPIIIFYIHSPSYLPTCVPGAPTHLKLQVGTLSHYFRFRSVSFSRRSLPPRNETRDLTRPAINESFLKTIFLFFSYFHGHRTFRVWGPGQSSSQLISLFFILPFINSLNLKYLTIFIVKQFLPSDWRV